MVTIYSCCVQPEKLTQLKLKSEIIKDKNGKTISTEEFVYNDIGKISRQDYKDENGNRKFYKTFEYDNNGNCIRTCEFSDDNEIQVSFEYSYDNNNNLIKSIERTSEGNVFEWTEILFEPNENLKIWITKDENGKIIHKTIENLVDHSERRFNDRNELYEHHFKKFDQEKRLVEKLITDTSGKEKEKHIYEYQEQKEIWKFIQNGSNVKTEEYVYDKDANLTFHIRKDSKGKCLEWYRFEYDKFGNKTKYFWGLEEDKQIGYKIFELICENQG